MRNIRSFELDEVVALNWTDDMVRERARAPAHATVKRENTRRHYVNEVRFSVAWWDGPELDAEAIAIRDELRDDGWQLADTPVALNGTSFFASAFDPHGTYAHGTGTTAAEAYRELRWRIRRGRSSTAA
jgi:hypothetical protein